MKLRRLLLCSLAGGLTLHAWLFCSYVVGQWSWAAFEALPQGHPVLAALAGSGLEAGLYHHHPAELQQFRATQSPTVPVLVYLPQGYNPLEPGQKLALAACSLATAAAAAWLLLLPGLQLPQFSRRMAVVLCIGLAVALSGRIIPALMLHFPARYVWITLADQAGAWLATAAVLAALTRPGAAGQVAGNMGGRHD
ncbi:MAG: hypothetical protein R3F46_02200 [bacterium]